VRNYIKRITFVLLAFILLSQIIPMVSMAVPAEEDFVTAPMVSAGHAHTVGLKKDGTVVAVGHNVFGHCNVSEWTDIIAVSAGGIADIGLKKDGRVVTAGNLANYYQDDISAWTYIIAVSPSVNSHIIGLRKDGTVVAVGNNYSDQCNVSEWTDIIAVSAGFYHTVGIKKDGTVIATGNNEYGECDVSGWTDIIAVSAGYNNTIGLKKDGTVVAVGRNDKGQCDISRWNLETGVLKPNWTAILNTAMSTALSAALIGVLIVLIVKRLKENKGRGSSELIGEIHPSLINISKTRMKAASIICKFSFIIYMILVIMIPISSSTILGTLDIGTIIPLALMALFYLKVLVPTPKNHKRAMTVILILLFLSRLAGFINGGIANLSNKNTFEAVQSFILLFASFEVVLLIGILFKKSTEKVAGIIHIISISINYAILALRLQEITNIDSGIAGTYSSFVMALILGFLPGVLLLSYPVLTAPVPKLKKTNKTQEKADNSPVSLN